MVERCVNDEGEKLNELPFDLMEAVNRYRLTMEDAIATMKERLGALPDEDREQAQGELCLCLHGAEYKLCELLQPLRKPRDTETAAYRLWLRGRQLDSIMRENETFTT